jgi:hypothetical protein
MSCYFRRIPELLKEAGLKVTPENKRAVDQLFHRLVQVEYKNCSDTWKRVKAHRDDPALRTRLVAELRKAGAKKAG